MGYNNIGDFMVRTDLIDEIKAEQNDEILGVEAFDKTIENVKISTVKIKNDYAQNFIGKPKGNYYTISFPRLDYVCNTQNIINSTVETLKNIYDKDIESALVVGLGNLDITPDALGPLTCSRILATRHLNNELKRNLGLDNLKSVCCLNPDVLGKTGIESYDTVYAIANKIKPDVIIAIDALACRDAERLCRTIQISDTGIIAGSGVNNARKALNHSALGIPVIAVGIPTVIDANSFFNTQETIMVTPKEIDLLVEKSTDILSRAINIFLQPDIDIDVIESLT